MSFRKDDSRTKAQNIDSIRNNNGDNGNNENDACLVIIHGNEEGKKFTLFSHEESDQQISKVINTVSIGRHQDNNIVLYDKFVSGCHVEILQKGGKFFVKDNNSTNGTLLNDINIERETLLKNQDKIKIGDTVLKFLQGDVEELFLDNLSRKINIDGLTDIFNKRFFEENFARIFTLAQRYKKNLSLIIFDIDDFKKINDNFGHDAGDFILSTLSRVVASRVRETDIFARIGGEEFAVICPETDINNSYKLAEILRSIINAYNFSYENIKIPVTISLGTCELNDSFENEKEMFKCCDKLLYKSKKSGKNRVSTPSIS